MDKMRSSLRWGVGKEAAHSVVNQRGLTLGPALDQTLLNAGNACGPSWLRVLFARHANWRSTTLVFIARRTNSGIAGPALVPSTGSACIAAWARSARSWLKRYSLNLNGRGARGIKRVPGRGGPYRIHRVRYGSPLVPIVVIAARASLRSRLFRSMASRLAPGTLPSPFRSRQRLSSIQ
jgi:hypothetical protein